MRKELKKRNNQSIKCYGVFKEYGTKRGWCRATLPTILLINIYAENGNYLTDHRLFNATKKSII